VTCPHLSKRIDGIYRMDIHHPPLAVGWTCEVCHTSGATNWPDTTHQERIEAHLAELARQSGNEMMVGRG
jgi:hypothetical protein